MSFLVMEMAFTGKIFDLSASMLPEVKATVLPPICD
jgi:hypothetical protein